VGGSREEATMSWRQDTIVHCKQAIAQLRHGIEQMHAGTFEVRELDHGRWVMVNDGRIEQDRKTIANLEEIIARAEEAEVNESRP
jgi:CCR4-NOT transcriptional regulation complex NOT5 subunit